MSVGSSSPIRAQISGQIASLFGTLSTTILFPEQQYFADLMKSSLSPPPAQQPPPLPQISAAGSWAKPQLQSMATAAFHSILIQFTSKHSAFRAGCIHWMQRLCWAGGWLGKLLSGANFRNFGPGKIKTIFYVTFGPPLLLLLLVWLLMKMYNYTVYSM